MEGALQGRRNECVFNKTVYKPRNYHGTSNQASIHPHESPKPVTRLCRPLMHKRHNSHPRPPLGLIPTNHRPQGIIRHQPLPPNPHIRDPANAPTLRPDEILHPCRALDAAARVAVPIDGTLVDDGLGGLDYDVKLQGALAFGASEGGARAPGVREERDAALEEVFVLCVVFCAAALEDDEVAVEVVGGEEDDDGRDAEAGACCLDKTWEVADQTRVQSVPEYWRRPRDCYQPKQLEPGRVTLLRLHNGLDDGFVALCGHADEVAKGTDAYSNKAEICKSRGC